MKDKRVQKSKRVAIVVTEDLAKRFEEYRQKQSENLGAPLSISKAGAALMSRALKESV